ncbi:MAG: DUF488 domain-containing protein [Geobacter sp.]|nr:DUF488 domain-containing protein [Geobacter sp.]
MIRVKRVYDSFEASDGSRFLVDRLWPRGIKKEELHLEAWLKELAPSNDLRQWFGHDPARWEEFCRRYHAELDGKRNVWSPLVAMAETQDVTLLFGAHDTEHNNATALREYLERQLT